MKRSAIVIGAGMGGLAAALRLARAGFDVVVLEARTAAGGLASGMELEGFAFDAGPYILLDRPGLEWSFDKLALNLASELPLFTLDDIYEVQSADGSCVRFHSSLEKTAAAFDLQWPGSGDRYTTFVRKMERIARKLRPMLETPRPTLLELIRSGGWPHAPFLMRSLASVLASAKLPEPIMQALAIWTHVAGQTITQAPSPLAFVPALMHSVGANYPKGGMRRIPQVVAKAATAAGVRIEYGVKARSIRTEGEKLIGVETVSGDFLPAPVVVSNCAALTTYLRLLDKKPPEAAALKKLPLQSPGVCGYLAVRGTAAPPYLQFKLGTHDERCRLLIRPEVVERIESTDGWSPVRLLAPLDYDAAEKLGAAGQREYLDRLLAEQWWRQEFSDFRVLATRIPNQWGSEYNLYNDSMNPVMTARFMRQGRVAHRSPSIRGLYLAGSSTHPGQWVSFCMMSGIHAAEFAIEDFR
jgi:phytoene desaturase